MFDTLIINQTGDITYNGGTGEFTLSSNGNYLISWWVAIDGTASTSSISFATQVNGASSVEGSAPIVTGQLNGTTLITVTGAPVTVTLINNSLDAVFFATTPVQANIIIAKVSI